MKRILIGTAILAMSLPACGDSSSTDDALQGVNSILILQRPRRAAGGDIFQYTSYQAGARIIELSPPTADGEINVVCCDHLPEFAEADISGYDLSFDATEIVFSAKLAQGERYGLFLLSIESGQVEQLPTDPNADYITPVFLPGDKIFFATNGTIDEDLDGTDEVQFRDEYERTITSQLGVINKDGTNEILGARNLSHRIFPTVMSDGRVLMTQWDHLGMVNAGRLVFSNPDMTTVREAFGKEGRGVTNSVYKAVEVSPGRVVAIGSSRDRTIQSGAILDIRLGETYTEDGQLRADREMSEANSSVLILTPGVPLGREPSFETIGRYYDAFPLNAGENLDLLVSWADGPVESGTLGAAGLTANFGIYMYDSESAQRRPILDDDTMWDIFPRPFRTREAPPVIETSNSHEYGETGLVGVMNVYESTRFNFEPGSAVGVRIREGFSGEEGVGGDFGLTEHEGAAILGIAPVHTDGSYAATIPASVPIAQQVVDRFGMAIGSEPVWISAAPGESRLCGGCHESRTDTTVINPGITDAFAFGPADMLSTVQRYDRMTTDLNDFVTPGAIVGVPWDSALQNIFDNNCTSCHNGVPGPANPSYTITDPETEEMFEWTFDLRDQGVTDGGELGEALLSGYSASHLSLMGPDMMMLEDAGLIIEGEVPIYVNQGSARASRLIEILNPPQLMRYNDQTGTVVQDVDLNQRAFEGAVHCEMYGCNLTPAEYYLLNLMADNGGQFYSRENAPGRTW